MQVLLNLLFIIYKLNLFNIFLGKLKTISCSGCLATFTASQSCKSLNLTFSCLNLLFVISDNVGKPKILLEIKENAIVQAKLFNNISVKNDIVLNKLVLEFAKETKLYVATTDIEQINNIAEAIA